MTTPTSDGLSPASLEVAPLAAFGREDVARAGGKGANLGQLVRSGHPVPDGFVVTADAAAGDDGPAGLRQAILAAYRSLGGGPVAVRSSATAEDLPGAAFAGQYDTALNVIGDDALLDAVQACWASLRSDRAVAYRRGRGLSADDVRIAVVVQRMVEPDVAGVMFTADPVTGARDQLLVEANAGLGEAVVAGMVTPDRYRLDLGGGVLDYRPGLSEVVVRAAPGGGVAHDAGGDPAAARLPEPVLGELARLGASIAATFGRPQDIEWAWADGKVWVLQARPMTALPPPPVALGRVQRRIVPVLLEMLPVRPYPLDMSMWLLPGLGRMVHRMLREIAGVRISFDTVLPETDGVVDRLAPPTPRLGRDAPSVLWRSVRRARRSKASRWADDPRFAAYLARVEELGAREVGALSWAALVRQPDEALDALDLMTDLRIEYLPHVAVSQVRLLLLLRVLGLSRLYPALSAGGDTRTGAANRRLADLAAVVRADPELAAAFRDLDVDALASRLAEPSFAALRSGLDDFAREFGHRETTSVLLLSEPTWGEAPATALGAVRALVDEAAPARDASAAALDPGRAPSPGAARQALADRRGRGGEGGHRHARGHALLRDQGSARAAASGVGDGEAARRGRRPGRG